MPMLLSGPPKPELPTLEMHDAIVSKTCLASVVLVQTYCCQRFWWYTPQLGGKRDRRKP